jgi:peptidyl-prolyl cis-trans isomerase A (cyclophilin A)
VRGLGVLAPPLKRGSGLRPGRLHRPGRAQALLASDATASPNQGRPASRQCGLGHRADLLFPGHRLTRREAEMRSPAERSRGVSTKPERGTVREMISKGRVRTVRILAIVAATMWVGGSAVGQTPRDRLKDPSLFRERCPDEYRARFETTKGVFVVAVERQWAPLAADRFYNLVKNGFYDGSRFFRVLDGFMAQFGLNGDPAIQGPWQTANLADEPVTKSNLRGWVSFTREGRPNSRFTMVFINYKDNSYLDADGFAPFGHVISGMDVVDALYGGYGRQNVPDQRRIVREGNGYLDAEYPRLDVVKLATIESAK